jgi:hypothetical protein
VKIFEVPRLFLTPDSKEGLSVASKNQLIVRAEIIMNFIVIQAGKEIHAVLHHLFHLFITLFKSQNETKNVLRFPAK